MVPILEAKPYTSPDPTKARDDSFTDMFAKAHAQSDLNSGHAALHHTLDQPGGGAKFDHQHGDFKIDGTFALLGQSGVCNPGGGGLVRFLYQKLSRELIWVKFYVFWGSAGGKVVDNGWYYSWAAASNFILKNKIAPVNFTETIPALYFTPVGQAGPGNFHGVLVWDYTVQTWTYFWDSGPNSGTFNTMINGRLTTDHSGWDITNGAIGSQFNVISAQGIYQYSGGIS